MEVAHPRVSGHHNRIDGCDLARCTLDTERGSTGTVTTTIAAVAAIPTGTTAHALGVVRCCDCGLIGGCLLGEPDGASNACNQQSTRHQNRRNSLVHYLILHIYIQNYSLLTTH